MSTAVSILGASILALLLAGYLGQQFLPPPKPRIVGIDLGTTFSCIGVYHAVTGDVEVILDSAHHKTIPSMVAFTPETELVGYSALAQAEHNPANTIYDAKRFIGKRFSPEEFVKEAERYNFKLKEHNGLIRFVVGKSGNTTEVSPEYIGSRILAELRRTAEANLTSSITKAVMSVPAEFDDIQRNYTIQAAKQAGIEVLRLINEPTAAALAYGLHGKEGVENVLVVDLGGGTLDVSLLNVQGGMFLTLAMAGNNHLGGQDFNLRLNQFMQDSIERKFRKPLTNAEDIQRLRLFIEDVKLNLTSKESVAVSLSLPSMGEGAIYNVNVTRAQFEKLNEDLFLKVLVPIKKVLETIELTPQAVDEIVLVGGSTRIPKVRSLIAEFFGKQPNVGVDPELAVAYGVSIQAGIIGGMWPLQVSAIELNTGIKKIKVE
ncbi:heat shock 70 kDa protein 13-like [Anneissia japonica]|uniref:heat shock 70 kDa protein 13-like n=1 Tax=Anneissia japonica TaxID=1529436 RepID=UPI00142552E5|nr:heat shock 70 kDa protein 13-like [Anneissia japonica]